MNLMTGAKSFFIPSRALIQWVKMPPPSYVSETLHHSARFLWCSLVLTPGVLKPPPLTCSHVFEVRLAAKSAPDVYRQHRAPPPQIMDGCYYLALIIFIAMLASFSILLSLLWAPYIPKVVKAYWPVGQNWANTGQVLPRFFWPKAIQQARADCVLSTYVRSMSLMTAYIEYAPHLFCVQYLYLFCVSTYSQQLRDNPLHTPPEDRRIPKLIQLVCDD